MDVELFTANTGIIPNNSTNSTTTTVTTSSPNDGKSFKQDLNENPDYIALTSSLRMAKITNTKINQDIIELSKLQQYYSSTANKEETIQFFLKLINNNWICQNPQESPNVPS